MNDGCTPTAVLPISLLYFKGNTLELQSNLLEWSTSTEINNDFFTIERSKNAIDFNSIGIVNGAGNSNSQIQYQLIDFAPIIGTNYYRLKQTDFNGDSSYSSIIAINNLFSDIKVYTSNHSLIIKSDKSSINGTIQVLDLTGRIVINKKLELNKTYHLSQLNFGIYLYKIISEQNIISEKFILR